MSELEEAEEKILQLEQQLLEANARIDRFWPLARQLMWIAYVWNDHNYDSDVLRIIRTTCQAQNINSFSDVNKFIDSTFNSQSLKEHNKQVILDALYQVDVNCDAQEWYQRRVEDYANSLEDK